MTVMAIIAVIASAMAVMFVLHTESDSSSAEPTDSGECGDDVRYTFTDGTLEISGWGKMYPYNDVHTPWYEYRSAITKIIIGNYITSLPAGGFADCKNLKELTVPNGLDCVQCDANPAFAGCDAIEKVRFTPGMDGYACFYTAAQGYNRLYTNTPWYQSRDTLTEVSFDEGVKSIGSRTFEDLYITSVVLPESVVKLASYCFLNCTKLTHLTIPVSLNSFGSEEFPAFTGCDAIEYVTFTEGNGTPYDYKHWWGTPCDTNLAPWNMNGSVGKKITITEEVTSLGTYMFYGCNIQELTISISFNAVWLDKYPAFEGMYGLQKVTFTPGSGYGFNYGAYEDINCWYKHTPWYMCRDTLTEIVFEDGIKHIGSDAFRELYITHIVIPDSVEALDNHTFFKCEQLTDLTIPITLNCVYNKTYPAFDQCYAISNLHLTAGKTGIGFDYTEYLPTWCSTFYGKCSITIDSDITYIGAHTLDGIVFIGTDGCVLQHTAEELSGHVFSGNGGILYLTDEKIIDFAENVNGGYVNNLLVDEGKFVDNRYMDLGLLCDEIPAISLDSIITPVSVRSWC